MIFQRRIGTDVWHIDPKCPLLGAGEMQILASWPVTIWWCDLCTANHITFRCREY